MKQIIICLLLVFTGLGFSQDKKTAAILKSAMTVAEKNVAMSYRLAGKYKFPNEKDTISHQTEVLVERLKGDILTEAKFRIRRNGKETHIYDGKNFLNLYTTDSTYALHKGAEAVKEAVENEPFLTFELMKEFLFPAKWNELFQDSSIQQITNVSLDTINKNLCHHIDIAYKDDSLLQNRLVHYWIDSKTFELRKYIYEVDYEGSHQYIEQNFTDIQANPMLLANERILRPLNVYNTQVPSFFKSNVKAVEPSEIDTLAALIAKDSGIVAPVVMLDSTKIDTLKLNLPPVSPITQVALNPTPITPLPEGKKDSAITVPTPIITVKKDSIPPVIEVKKDSLPATKPILPSLIKGENAPNFSLSTTDGTTISLQDLQNKVVLINFWDRSCDTCINILPILQNLQNRYESRGFMVLELYTSDAVKDTFHTLSNVKYKIGLNAQQVANQYHVQQYPTLYLIDKAGKIFDMSVGRVALKEEDWNAKIEACLQQ